MTPDETAHLASRCGLRVNPGNLKIDQSTTGRTGSSVDMRSFFKELSGCDVEVMDVSDYEGAEVIADLNEDVPSDFHGRYDVVLEGGVLDNLFDPANAMRNLHRMLKPRGRLFSYNVFNASLFNSAYQGLPPDWFFDYFAWNGYSDLALYFVDRGSSVAPYEDGRERIFSVNLVRQNVESDHAIRALGDPGIRKGLTRRGPEWMFFAAEEHLGSLFRCDITTGHIPCGDVMLVAEKGEDRGLRNPVQIHYRAIRDNFEMFRNALAFVDSDRPLILGASPKGGPGRYLALLGKI